MNPPITYGTLCSGIDAVSLAWEPLGMVPVFSAENAVFPSKVLAHHWPDVPNLGDITAIDGIAIDGTGEYMMVDVLWGSLPCQDFSDAGKKKGLNGSRGALTLAGLRLVDEIDPPVFVFENVEGLLTEKKTNAFGQFLGRLAGEACELLPPGGTWSDAGYVSGPRRAIAWRLLDAQHFGLPQQRVRLFVVACPHAYGIDPRDILFERVAPGATAGERQGGEAYPVAGAPGCALAYGLAIRGRKHGQQLEERGPISNCLRASQGGSDKGMVLVWTPDGWRARNMTAVECERSMGIPDNHTLIPGASESARLHAIGNSLPVPIVQWIGERILKVFA